MNLLYSFTPIPESYTNSKCLKCGKSVKRPHQHYVVCKNCGKLNADLNGAVNILKRGSKNLSLEIFPLCQFKWIRGKVNSWLPVETGKGDKPPCSFSKETTKSFSL